MDRWSAPVLFEKPEAPLETSPREHRDHIRGGLHIPWCPLNRGSSPPAPSWSCSSQSLRSTASICVLLKESTTGCYRAGREEEREREKEREEEEEERRTVLYTPLFPPLPSFPLSLSTNPPYLAASPSSPSPSITYCLYDSPSSRILDIPSSFYYQLHPAYNWQPPFGRLLFHCR